MAGSTYGSYFRITTWGESHGKGVGVVVDGCPAGLPLCEENIQKYLNRRKPGQNPYSTPRKEDDAVEILSGIFEGHTTGTPISMMVWNKSQRSADYSEIANYYRPGHADMAYDLKYGFRDYRGGGRSSGRETIGRVAAGAIAATILDRLGISLLTYTKSIGPVTADADHFNPSVIFENPLYMPDAKAAEEAERYLQECIQSKDSAGGIIECVVQNMKPMVLENRFLKSWMPILGRRCFPLVLSRAWKSGDGLLPPNPTGHKNNDEYTLSADGDVIKLTNHSGGILGGISDVRI